MRADLPDRRLGAPRKPAPLVAALAVALCCALAVQATRAPAQSLEQRLGEQQARLDRAEERRQGVAAQVEGLNAEVDALLGEVSALQLERDAVRDRLAAKQAQLDRATAALERQRRRLEAARERLRRSLVVLRRRLVAIYKAGTPDTLGIVLGSQTWSEAVAQAAYLRQVQEHDDAMVARVRALRDEAREGVRRMGAIRDRLRAARDAIAVEERQLARTQATLSGRFAELRAAQAQRQELLATLGARVDELRGEVSSLNERLEAQQADPGAAYAPAPPPVPGSAAELLPSGLAAAPADAPAAVVAVIEAANRIAHTPYLWGGGHGSFDSPGYDCSGAVSYALGGGGFLDSPLDSTGLSFWGEPGSGSWITVYANSGHAYAVIAGLRWDTSGGAGPRWHSDMRSGAGYVARHPAGY
jgi:peptidoglycan hydrolase CwlO-like protein